MVPLRNRLCLISPLSPLLLVLAAPALAGGGVEGRASDTVSRRPTLVSISAP